MKKSFYFLAIVLIVSFLGGCKKDPLCELADNQARLQGFVLEKGTKKPVEGVMLYLTNCVCSTQLGGGCSCTVIDSTKSDKDGHYAFTYIYKGAFAGSSFELRAKVNDKYYKRNKFETIVPTEHIIWDYNLELIPKAWVKVHIKNVNHFQLLLF